MKMGSTASPARKFLTLISLVSMLVMIACGSATDNGPDESPQVEVGVIPNIRPVPVPTSLQCSRGTSLTYENFGAAFMRNYCTTCHATSVPEDARSGAPLGIDFDVAQNIVIWRTAILQQTTSPNASMPPSGNLPATQKSMLVEWLNCGGPTD